MKLFSIYEYPVKQSIKTSQFDDVDFWKNVSIITNMDLEDKIKIIPIEQPFLRIFAKNIWQKFKNDSPDLSNTLIIFPNQRNKFYFRRYLLEVSNNKGIIPPIMKTIEELTEEIYEILGGKKSMLLNRIERNFVLKKVIDSLKVHFWQDLPFLKFISIGNRLLQFFDELAKERVDLHMVEERVLAGHYPERYVKDELLIIKRIYNEYRASLKEQGYQDEIDKYNLIHNNFTIDRLKQIKEYKYFGIAGLVATTTVENKIIEEILENLPAELVLHSGTPEEIKQSLDHDKPFHIHNKLLNSLSLDISSIPTQEPAPLPVFHIKFTSSEFQQTLYLKNLIAKLKDRYEPHRVGIIVTDETTIYSFTETLKAIGVEYNVSTGFPLIQSIPYSFLSQLKEVIETSCHYQEFFAFIKHPLFKNAIVDEKSLRPLIYNLEKAMVKNQFNYFDPGQHTDKELTPLLTLIKTCLDTAQSNLALNEYINNIIKMLNTLLFYNQDLIKSNAPGINEFFDRLTNLARLRIPEQIIEPGIRMLDFILRILKDETYNLRGDPMKGVQCIGLLEARNLDFDCVIIPSMNEGIFPKRSEKDLFVNQLVRKDVHLPYDKERENLYYYYFTELTNGKKEVYISYVEEGIRNIRSRFVDFLVDQGILVDESKIPLDRSSLIISKKAVIKDNRILSSLYRQLAGRGLSPTSLKDYKECPYRFYLKYLLNIQKPDEISEEAGPAEWGTIIHETLKNFYKFDFPNGLMESDLARAKTLLNKRLDNAVKITLAQKPKAVTFLDLEMYKKRLDEFLQSEIQRFQSGFKIDQEKLEKRIKHEITLGKHSVNLYGYTDRVDIIDNKYYVLDYKSRAPSKKKYQICDEFVEFQLPLYAFIVSDGKFEKIRGLAYYVIANKIKITESVKADEVVQYLNDFKEQILIPTINEILDPEKSFCQTDNQESCAYCPYIDLCGVKNV